MKSLIFIGIQNELTRKNNLYTEKLFFDSINSAIKDYCESDSNNIFVQQNNNQL